MHRILPFILIGAILLGALGITVVHSGSYCVVTNLGYANTQLFFSGAIYDPNKQVTTIKIQWSPSQPWNLTIQKFVVVYSTSAPGCGPQGFNIQNVVAKYTYYFNGQWDYEDPSTGIYQYYVQVPIPDLKYNSTYYFSVLMYATNTTGNLTIPVFIGTYTTFTVQQPQNTSGGIFGWLGSAIGNALASIGRIIVNAFMAVIPQPLKQLFNAVWQFFTAVATMFYQAVLYITSFAAFFKLLAILIPVIVVAIMIYDPFLIPAFFMWLFDQMRKIVQFIRSLLPI